MLLSEREMGLSDEHTGIIELADGIRVIGPLAGPGTWRRASFRDPPHPLPAQTTLAAGEEVDARLHLEVRGGLREKRPVEGGQAPLVGGNAGSAGSGEYNLDLVDLFFCDLDRIEQRGSGDDRRAVLIVVKDRNVAACLETLLDLEAIGRADVLEVDTAEGGSEKLAKADDLLRVLAVDFDVENVDIGEAFEEDALALHHRLAGHRTDIAEAEDGGAVGDHSNEVPLVGVLVDQLGVFGDRETRLGNTGGVGQ